VYFIKLIICRCAVRWYEFVFTTCWCYLHKWNLNKLICILNMWK